MNKHSKAILMDVLRWATGNGFLASMTADEYGEVITVIDDKQGTVIEIDEDLVIYIHDINWKGMNTMQSVNCSLLDDCKNMYKSFTKLIKKGE